MSGRLKLLSKGLIQLPQQHKTPSEPRSERGVAQSPAASKEEEEEEEEEHHIKLDKSNIILLGPTGCGKWGGVFSR